MKKEEFLAMSLPYELYIQNGKEADKVVGIVGDSIMTLFRGHLDNVWHIDDAKPICRPLTDLTKPITQKDYNNGEPFVPIERIKESQHHLFLESQHHLFFRYDITNPINGLQFSEFSKLLSWHFNLMDEGEEFVDVNTLDINPYA